jgi:iron(III) transport system substrate-binding protein
MPKLSVKQIVRTTLVAAVLSLPGVVLAQAQAELDALIKAAKAEGEVNFYSGATENVAKRTGDAFQAKYGIRYSFIRLAGVQTERRFGTEAEAGTFPADFYMVSTAVPFAIEAIKKGWVEPIDKAGIPAIRSGTFPARFVTGPTAVVQVAPWGIAYNTERVRGADVPRDWLDLIKPQFKGQLLLPDPRSSNAYITQWSVILDKYGEGYFARLREMNPRQYASGVPSTNSLGAGEGAVQAPSVAAQIQATKDKGAPINHVIPSYTSGVEMHVVLTNRAKAKRPAAARLFAEFVMTPEGNAVFNSEPGSFSVYDTSNMPKDYVSPKVDALARTDLIAKLLGFK